MPPRRPPHPSRPPLTHFLCIPLLTLSSKPHLRTSHSNFKTSVTTLSTSKLPNGIPSTAIRPVGTLHLTLGVMSLMTSERVKEALGVLRGLDLKGLLRDADGGGVKEEGGEWKGKRKEKGTLRKGEESVKEAEMGKTEVEEDPAPLVINLRGLTSMHTPSSTSVLYANPQDTTNRLQPFCSKLRDIFTNAGLMTKEDRPLLLHATIVNMVYVKGGRGGETRSGQGRIKARLRLDAREVLKMCEDWMWAEGVMVERVAICRMGARKVGEDLGPKEDEESDEEYVVEGEVEMPV